MAPLETLPGFRRRVRITPGDGWVSAEVEDDYHHMGGVLRHAGVALDAFAARGEKQSNCTHLHDLAILAAAHAGDDAATVYDILTSDPVEGRQHTELRRSGAPALRWEVTRFEITAPAELAGVRLDKLKPAVAAADEAGQEMVRVLRWATMISHGRSIPLEQQSDASRYPGNCYTFQPENAAKAVRVGKIKDFSAGDGQPLDQPGVAVR